MLGECPHVQEILVVGQSIKWLLAGLAQQNGFDF
jgi:hypothetical protein